jgi:hypothetical protein
LQQPRSHRERGQSSRLLPHITLCLRHVVFVREPPLGSGFDGQRIGL